MARKFLYFVAVCIVLVIVGGIALSIWSREATEIAKEGVVLARVDALHAVAPSKHRVAAH